MPRPSRQVPRDEELGKRDDDHRPEKKVSMGPDWQHRRLPVRRNLKRFLFGLTGLILVYIFIKNLPTDLRPPRERPHYIHNTNRNPIGAHKDADAQKAVPHPPSAEHEENTQEESGHWFNGPIKFYQLASTLYNAQRLDGDALVNEHVLFAASSLKSAAVLIPLACAMGRHQRNHVQFVMMGRDSIFIDDLKTVNGYSEDCNVMFHDARPDFSPQSSDYRMQASVAAAIGHINTYMHPQAVLVDASENEDVFLLTAMRERASPLGITLIQIPSSPESRLLWLTRLDSSSLRAWNDINIEILVHAQPAASGSLIRLLLSLSRADYLGSSPPRLTIELPEEVDDATREFLESYQWPPSNEKTDYNGLVLHHRLRRQDLTAEESSARFVESFWPATPEKAQILVLSPQAEVSAIYFQYLKYTALEYRFSRASYMSQGILMGISLDLPTTYLNDSAAFASPQTASMIGDSSIQPFLWQAPNSNAALYFGDRWVELHSFMGYSLDAERKVPTSMLVPTKYTSEAYPSWIEYILRLARIRSYVLLYPNMVDDNQLVTIHTELFHLPEEYSVSGSREADVFGTPLSESEELTADPRRGVQHVETPLLGASLLKVLYPNDLLPKLDTLLVLSFDGIEGTLYGLPAMSSEYAEAFRGGVGGCAEDASPKARVKNDASDLFCSDSVTTTASKVGKVKELLTESSNAITPVPP